MKYPMELNMGEYGLEQIFPDTWYVERVSIILRELHETRYQIMVQ
jgi:hypothetical protein